MTVCAPFIKCLVAAGFGLILSELFGIFLFSIHPNMLCKHVPFMVCASEHVDTHLYVEYSPVNGMGLQQSHSASTESSTCHPATKHPLNLHGCKDQLIQLPAAHLIQISDKQTESHVVVQVLHTINIRGFLVEEGQWNKQVRCSCFSPTLGSYGSPP